MRPHQTSRFKHRDKIFIAKLPQGPYVLHDVYVSDARLHTSNGSTIPFYSWYGIRSPMEINSEFCIFPPFGYFILFQRFPRRFILCLCLQGKSSPSRQTKKTFFIILFIIGYLLSDLLLNSFNPI